LAGDWRNEKYTCVVVDLLLFSVTFDVIFDLFISLIALSTHSWRFHALYCSCGCIVCHFKPGAEHQHTMKNK